MKKLYPFILPMLVAFGAASVAHAAGEICPPETNAGQNCSETRKYEKQASEMNNSSSSSSDQVASSQSGSSSPSDSGTQVSSLGASSSGRSR